MKTTYRNIAATALAGALLCGTAACSAESAKPAADGKSDDGKTAAKTVEMSPVAAVEKATANNKDLTSLTYSMSGKIPGEGPVEADAALGLKPLGMQMTMRMEVDGKQEEVEIRLTEGGLYLNGGKEAAAEMDGKSWMKFPMDPSGEGSAAAGLPSQFDQNPAEESASLTAADDLKKVGEETVDGVATTHYTGTLTLADLRESLKDEKDAKAKERREKGLKDYEDMGVDKLTMDMWIDKGDLTKQVRIQGAAKKGPLDLTIKFLAYNKPVTVKAPPASETVDLAEMMEGAQAG
ncbi:DUF6612 family protein [Streptomyces sp. NPDC056672]|uniref:DUF6612 family protein n=1 Tax=Streptomyces sp. NPDC056672 TaxID=3345906 RepID=UPI0036919E48